MFDSGIVLPAVQRGFDSQGFIFTGQIPLSQFKLPDLARPCQGKSFYLNPQHWRFLG